MLRRSAPILLASLFFACGSDGTPADPPADDASAPPASPDGGGADAPVNPCPRAPAPEDRTRKVVVSHPFVSAGTKGTSFEVYELSTAGALSKTNVTFEMGTALSSRIVFTPDGLVGLVAQDDGSVGVFSFDESGAVRVVHPAFREGGFYARSVVVDAAGVRAFVLDENTDANGGGVYELAIGCDGTLTSRGRVIPGGTAHAMALLPGEPNKAVLAAGRAFGSAMGDDAHLVDLDALSLVASGRAFGSGNAIVSSVAVMPDGKYALVADDGVVAGNRVAVVALPAMTLVQTITTDYPAAVVASPFGNAAIVLNDDSTDEISVLRYDPANATPFTNTGYMTYAFPKPQIPVTAALVERGALKGRVLVSENLAVRQLQFELDGTVTDVERFSSGAGIPAIVGVVGVQP